MSSHLPFEEDFIIESIRHLLDPEQKYYDASLHDSGGFTSNYGQSTSGSKDLRILTPTALTLATKAACSLWDMSTVKSVADYLFQHSILDIIKMRVACGWLQLHAHSSSSLSPPSSSSLSSSSSSSSSSQQAAMERFLEVTYGLTVNLLSFSSAHVAQRILEDKDFIQGLNISIFSTINIPMLIQIFRLLSALVSSYSASSCLNTNELDDDEKGLSTYPLPQLLPTFCTSDCINRTIELLRSTRDSELQLKMVVFLLTCVTSQESAHAAQLTSYMHTQDLTPTLVELVRTHSGKSHQPINGTQKNKDQSNNGNDDNMDAVWSRAQPIDETLSVWDGIGATNTDETSVEHGSRCMETLEFSLQLLESLTRSRSDWMLLQTMQNINLIADSLVPVLLHICSNQWGSEPVVSAGNLLANIIRALGYDVLSPNFNVLPDLVRAIAKEQNSLDATRSGILIQAIMKCLNNSATPDLHQDQKVVFLTYVQFLQHASVIIPLVPPVTDKPGGLDRETIFLFKQTLNKISESLVDQLGSNILLFDQL